MNTIQEEPTTIPEPEAPPMSYDAAKMERLVFEAPPGLEEPIKTKTRQTKREYMRQYYHKTKAEIACPFCNMTYTCKSSLVKHQRRSLKCAVSRIDHICGEFNVNSDIIKDNVHKHEVVAFILNIIGLANKTKTLNTK